jgi:hypothetical protein
MSKRKRSGNPYNGKQRTVGYYDRFKQSSEELKYYDFVRSSTSIPGETWSMVAESTVLNMAQGTGPSERIGRKITLKGVFVRLQVTAEGREDFMARMIVVNDKQTNGTAMTPSDLFGAGVLGQPNNPDMFSFYELANKNRFRVLHDEYVRVPVTAPTDASLGLVNSQQIRIDCNKRLNLPMEFSGTTGAVSEIKSYNIRVLLFIERQPNSVMPMAFECVIRSRYLD